MTAGATNGSLSNPTNTVQCQQCIRLNDWCSKNASDKMKEVFETLFGKNFGARGANKMSDGEQNPVAASAKKRSVISTNSRCIGFRDLVKRQFSDGVTRRSVPKVLR